VVPSDMWPTLAAAAAHAMDGTHIQISSGHTEELRGPLILDQAVCIEGPADCSARFVGADGIIVAAGNRSNTVVVRRIRLYVTAGPAMVVAGGCTVDTCEIRANGVGIEAASHTGHGVQVRRTVVRGCQVGISLAGGAVAAVLDNARIEHCQCGVLLTGLELEEGWNKVLVSLAGVAFVETDADLRVRAWSIREKASGVVRKALPDQEVTISGWPKEPCSNVAPTDGGAVVLTFKEGWVNATLFEAEDDAEEGGSHSDVSPSKASFHEADMLALETKSDP